MVSEPTNFEVEGSRSTHNPAEVPTPAAAAPEPQPRWMSVSVALVGIIGLLVMIFLVRG
jgi:hypothetical protein